MISICVNNNRQPNNMVLNFFNWKIFRKCGSKLIFMLPRLYGTLSIRSVEINSDQLVKKIFLGFFCWFRIVFKRCPNMRNSGKFFFAIFILVRSPLKANWLKSFLNGNKKSQPHNCKLKNGKSLFSYNLCWGIWPRIKIIDFKANRFENKWKLKENLR